MLIILATAWFCGILVTDVFPVSSACLGAAILSSSTAALFTSRGSHLRLMLLCVCFAALGGARMEAGRVPANARSVWLLNERGELQVDGVVAEDVRRTQDGQRVLIQVRRIAFNGQVQGAEGLVLATLPAYPERRYGDRLLLTGTLVTPREAERPGQFDYRDYLARKGIFSLMEPQSARLLSERNGSVVWSMLLDVREQARSVLLRELPEPQASLAIGVLLGLQAAIPDAVSADFSITGTSHILVISGWNISIIAIAFYKAAERFRVSKRSAFWVILASIWLYTLFVGAAPTVIRAAVMGTIVVVGQRLERPAHAWTTLFAACWAMTIWNPQTLWDLGFQLSALATASLFAFGKGTEAVLLRTPLRAGWLDWAREALTATLAAQILALPLILYQFGNLSLIAPLANVVLLPVVPTAMLFGALSLVAGMVYLPLGQVLATLPYLFFAWLTEGARYLAQIPGAAVQIPAFPLWLLLGYYSALHK